MPLLFILPPVRSGLQLRCTSPDYVVKRSEVGRNPDEMARVMICRLLEIPANSTSVATNYVTRET